MVAVDLGTVWLQGFVAGFLIAAMVGLVRLGVKLFKRIVNS